MVNDIQTLYEPTWNRRKLRDKPYHEAMEPQVPSMLIELLSHQNFADMRYGLDPTFRFTVSRAIYKGILKYLHEKDGIPYVVEPLPVSHFSIAGKDGRYTLSWKGVDDPLEPTAKPTYYIVYERIDNGAFTELEVVDNPSINISISDNQIHSFKIVAANDGGISFPSEILSVCDIAGSDKPQVLIINGFTRISGPAEIYAEGRIGFDYAEDHGVPYYGDIHFTGEQTEFRPEAKWVTNDAPGHGSSRATHETEVFAGNTFDFVFVHGQSIRKAGFPFISCGVDAFIDGNAKASPIIDLILGKQKEIT
ncbi:MAG TPA: xanthan lyase, partial [Porphyromonadaceae bacterium]|nr:xanthan lyase [Porphyromonadaceae bacterium]